MITPYTPVQSYTPVRYRTHLFVRPGWVFLCVMWLTVFNSMASETSGTENAEPETHLPPSFLQKGNQVSTLVPVSAGEVEEAVSEALLQNRLVRITGDGLSVPASLKQITSLPVVFRTTVSGYSYDLVVLSMSLTPAGAVLRVGGKFQIPDSEDMLYFGAEDIAVSGKSGFQGALKLVGKGTSGTDAVFDMPGLSGKMTMMLDRSSEMVFNCGNFAHFEFSGSIEARTVAGESGGALTLHFLSQRVTDWQDMFLEVKPETSFYASGYTDLGFNLSDGQKAYADFSILRNAAGLPACAQVHGEAWKGLAFPDFNLKAPVFFRLRPGVQDYVGKGKNLFIDHNGPLGTVTAHRVYALNEAYTGTEYEYDLSLESFTADFGCNGQILVTMLGQIALPWCGPSGGSGPLLWYSCRYTNNRYEWFVNDTGSGSYTTSIYTLPGGSTVEFVTEGHALKVLTTLPEKPSFITDAYQNSICKDFPVTLSASGCTKSLIWSDGSEGGEITIKPQASGSYAVECRDEYCITSVSDSLYITVYETLPPPSLTAGADVICSYESTGLVAANSIGRTEWKMPSSAGFAEKEGVQPVVWPGVSSSNVYTYTVRNNLNGCLSTEVAKNITVHPEPALPVLYSNVANNTIDRGGLVSLGGNCSSGNRLVWENLPEPTLSLNASSMYQAYCLNDATGCSSRGRSEIAIQVLYLPPASPSPLVVTGTGLDFITLNWQDRSGNEDGFRLWRSATPEFENPQLITQTGPDQTNFRDNRLSEGNTYYYRVSAYNRYDEVWSETTTGQTAVRPGAPQIYADRSTVTRGGTVQVNGSCSTGTLEWLSPQGFGGGMRQQNDQETYTARCISNGNAGPEASVNVTVCDLPTASVTVNDLRFEAGSSGNLTAQGCEGGSLQWSNGQSGRSIQVSVAGNYTVTCTISNACGNTSATASAQVIIEDKPCNPPGTPWVHLDNMSLPQGGSGTLSVHGCEGGSVRWDNGSTERNRDVNQAGNYSVTCTVSNDCGSASATAHANVSMENQPCNPPATPWVHLDNMSLPHGGSGTLWVHGCEGGSVRWDNGSTNRNRDVNQAGNYSVTCTVSNDCGSTSATAHANVTMENQPCNPPGTPWVHLDNMSLPHGGSGMLWVHGCEGGSVRWDNGSTDRNRDVNQAGNYSVTCTVSNDCGSTSATAHANVTMENQPCNPPATPWVHLDNMSLPHGGSGMLWVHGCEGGSVRWDNGSTDRNRDVNQAGNYSVTCTVSNDCGSASATAHANVTMENQPCNPPGTPWVHLDNMSLPHGGSGTLWVHGCEGGSVRWDNGSTDRNRDVNQAGNYSATCTVSNDCGSTSATAHANVTMENQPCNLEMPVISYQVEPDGKNVSLNVNNCREGAEYTWTRQESAAPFFPGTVRTGGCSMQLQAVNNNTFTVYSRLGGCQSPSASVTVSVPRGDPIIILKRPEIAVPKDFLCPGETMTVQLSGCSSGTYWWKDPSGTQHSTQSSSLPISVPGTYAVSCSSFSSGLPEYLQLSASIHIGQSNPPRPFISGPSEVNSGHTVTLTASGCPSAGDYRWSFNEAGQAGNHTGQQISRTLNSAADFRVHCETNGCAGEPVSQTVTVKSTPSFPDVIGTDPGPGLNCRAYHITIKFFDLKGWSLSYKDCNGNTQQKSGGLFNNKDFDIQAVDGSINCKNCSFELKQ